MPDGNTIFTIFSHIKACCLCACKKVLLIRQKIDRRCARRSKKVYISFTCGQEGKSHSSSSLASLGRAPGFTFRRRGGVSFL